jgi:ribosome maturation factor RimP
VDGDNVAIDLEGEAETALVPFAWISEAKLVLNDRLLKHGADARAARIARDVQEEPRQ